MSVPALLPFNSFRRWLEYFWSVLCCSSSPLYIYAKQWCLAQRFLRTQKKMQSRNRPSTYFPFLVLYSCWVVICCFLAFVFVLIYLICSFMLLLLLFFVDTWYLSYHVSIDAYRIVISLCQLKRLLVVLLKCHGVLTEGEEDPFFLVDKHISKVHMKMWRY